MSAVLSRAIRQDIESARRFLTLFDEDAEQFTFQTFDDLKSRKSNSLARILHGTIDQRFDELSDLQQRGAGVFVMVQRGDGKGRSNDNVTGIRCVFQEDDGGGENLPLEPHIIVESSTSKYHRYLLVDDLSLDDRDLIQQVLIDQYGSDPKAKDRARVLRLPGFLHQKDPAHPHLVNVIHESGTRPYTRDQILAAFKPAPIGNEKAPAGSASSVRVHTQLQRDLRSALFSMRADDRDLWIAMAHALRDLDDIGRGLWLDWSISSELYEVAEAARVWDSIKDPKSGYAAVFKAAQGRGWANPAGGSGALQEWPAPQPLAVRVEPKPYPLDALPDTIRAVVQEVAGFVKAPWPLVASSALAALSIAIQSHADAKRAEKLTGPVSLFLLTIADSGERKSTCDGFFTKAIHEYEETQADLAKPTLKDHKAAIEAWEAKRSGIKEKIRQLAKENKPTGDKEAALRDLEHDKPEPPRVPRLLYADATPEALAYGLAKNWPSGGVVSAEAGIVFGAHGMGKDSVMRNLALLNVLWDGGKLNIDRRTAESFTVRGARLTVALQVQEATLRSFFDRSGGLARGTGFLARFLVAWPESTQGFRPFTEAPANWPALAAFNRRIAAILEQPALLDEDGALGPPLLPLSADAKAAWVTFHDAIESELASGGELYDVRDVASKSADNAARLAALFQIFEHGMGDAVGFECFESASRIVAWHLNESRRFFGELALPVELADAARLDSWLIEYCRRERTQLVPIAKLQQGGPGGLRSKATIETALRELEDAGRARMMCDGRRKLIAVNPALVIEGGAS